MNLAHVYICMSTSHSVQTEFMENQNVDTNNKFTPFMHLKQD